MLKQRTIKKEVTFSGIGVHTGSRSEIIFKPAKENTGIVFIRGDLPGKPEVKAQVALVSEVLRGTTIGDRTKAHIHTVEHVLAAISSFAIDNLYIELNASEPPVGDGSSITFVNMIKNVGILEQDAPKNIYELKEKVVVTSGDSYLIAIPYDGFKISYTVAFDNHRLGAQYLSLDITAESFEKELSPCRTFCFYREVEALMDQGLIKGGSLDNAVVIGDEAIFSKEALRFNDEFVRHKMLDLVGDLRLIGCNLKAHIIAVKSGHALNVKLSSEIKKLMDAAEANKDKNIEKENIKSTTVSKKEKDMTSEQGFVMDVNQIKEILPHRYPFLLVDRILEMDEKRIVGLKNVTANEEFFNGHFPGHPVMPGVLQIEAMAQVAGVMMLNKEENRGKLAYFMGIENVRFRRPVVPGDQLIMEIEILKIRTRNGKVLGTVKVDGNVVSQAELSFALVER